MEVHAHDLFLFVVNLAAGVVGWEYEVDLPAEGVDADDPVEGGVHVLLLALRVALELIVHLVQLKDEVHREDVLRHQVAELYRQVHLVVVEEADRVLLAQRLANYLVELHRDGRRVLGEVAVDRLQELVGKDVVQLEEEHDERLLGLVHQHLVALLSATGTSAHFEVNFWGKDLSLLLLSRAKYRSYYEGRAL